MQNVNRRPNHEHIFMKQNVLCNFSSALVPLPLPPKKMSSRSLMVNRFAVSNPFSLLSHMLKVFERHLYK